MVLISSQKQIKMCHLAGFLKKQFGYSPIIRTPAFFLAEGKLLRITSKFGYNVLEQMGRLLQKQGNHCAFEYKC